MELILPINERDMQELAELESRADALEHLREKYMTDLDGVITSVKLSDKQIIIILKPHEKD